MRSRIEYDILKLEQSIADAFKAIPFEFLFREPRIIALNPSIVQLRDERPDDIVFLYDLFTVDLFKRKAIRNTRDYVFANRERLVQAYQYYSVPITIPIEASFDEPLGVLIRRFIFEYVDRMRCRNNVLIDEERIKREKRLDMFVATYDDRDILSLSRDMLADKYGMTAERIRQLLLGKENTIGITLCRAIIDGSYQCDDFSINPILQGKFFDLLLSNQSTYSAEVFNEEFGIPDDKTRKFLLDILGYSYCDSNVYFEPLIIRGEQITSLNRNAGPFMKFFTDNALYVSLEDEVAPYMQGRLPGNKELVDLMLDIAKVSDRFESKIDEEGDLKYGLKWQYLQTFPSRVVRILYEAGRPMSSTEAKEEYNRRASGTAIEMEFDAAKFTRKGHPLLGSIGKTGTIQIEKGKPAQGHRKKGAQELIDAYFREHSGLSTIEDMKTFLDETGYSYPIGTIKTYMSKVGRIVRGQEDLYVHEAYLDKYPEYTTSSRVKNQASDIMPLIVKYLVEHNHKSTMKELTDMCFDKTGNSIRDTSLRMMLDAYPEIIGNESVGKRGKYITLLLSDEDANSIEPSSFDKKGVEYHKQILATAKEMLENSKDGVLPIKVIFEATVKYVPEGKRTNIIYKLISGSNDFQSYTLDKKRFVRLVNKQ